MQRFSKVKVLIVTDYKGLDVIAINQLRRQLREIECEYQVVKNSLLIRAAEETDIALIKDMFKGPNAVALSYDDPVTPAKVRVVPMYRLSRPMTSNSSEPNTVKPSTVTRPSDR